jgi:hypothetical protein
MKEPGYFRRAIESIKENRHKYSAGVMGVVMLGSLTAAVITIRIQEIAQEVEKKLRMQKFRQEYDQRQKLRTEYDGLLQDAETKADKNNNDILESSEISDLLEGTGCKFSLSKGVKAKIEWTEEEPELRGTNTDKPIIYLNVNDIRRYLGDNQLKKTG